MGSVGRGTVVPELQRALGIEARALLDRFNFAPAGRHEPDGKHQLRKVSYLQLLLGEFQDKAESLLRL
jgi:hypothetical protein